VKPIAPLLLAWFSNHGRQQLPWQRPRTPYRVWLSEVMLQQTQVATVIPYFERFTDSFPELADLASAEVDQVLHLWSGLGYYSRARNLHQAAQLVEAQHQGELPRNHQQLLALPGIGRSTAGAIMAQAFGEPHAILDGNVRRVLCRLHRVDGWPGSSAVQRHLWRLAESYTPTEAVADYTQAIMDLGAMVCTPRAPRCSECPLSKQCLAFHEGDAESYPEKRAAKPVAVRQLTLLLLHDEQGRILMQRRPPSGIWGGLWSLPELPQQLLAEDSDDMAEWLEREWGIQPLTAIKTLPQIGHRLTHLQLQITPLEISVAPLTATRVMECEGALWYKTDTIGQLGLPVPVARLLEGLSQTDIDEETA